jgi:transposase
MRAIQLKLKPEEIQELGALYEATKDIKLKLRLQAVLLSAAQNMKAWEIARIVRKSERTVQRWLKSYQRQGIAGLSDAPRSGAPRRISDQYRRRAIELARQRPRSLGLDFSIWFLSSLTDQLEAELGERYSTESVRLILKEAEITFSRPQHQVSSPDPEYEVKKRR